MSNAIYFANFHCNFFLGGGAIAE